MKPVRLPGKRGNNHFETNNPHPHRQGNTSHFNRLEENVTYEICIQNLPRGITQEGVKNLLTTGKPLSVNYYREEQKAFVTFRTHQEAELNQRHLDKAPPYNLKVDIHLKRRQRRKDNWRKSKEPESDRFLSYSNDNEEDGVNELLFLENDKRKEEVQKKLTTLKNTLGYDPSIRMYQSWLDYKNGSRRVSLGRGFTYMGDKDRFVGGLQAFHSASENFSLKDEIAYPCEYCKSLTVKICGRCEKPYCSMACLTSSRLNHEEDGCSLGRKRELRLRNFTQQSTDKPVVIIDPLPLKPDNTVIITTYHTLRTLYVRQVDKPSDEGFCNLCNEVAAAALEGKPLKKIEVGLLCIARYYEDLGFYRAEICSIEEEKVNVTFIDFGNSQETDVKDLREMPKRIKEQRKLATKVELNDVPDGSSLKAVDYLNRLTAESSPLVVKSIDSSNRVMLMEKDSNTHVNNEITQLLKPAWSKELAQDCSINCGKPFYFDSLQPQDLEIGETYNLVITFFDEEDFVKTGVFWVVDEDSDSLLHVRYEMQLRMMEWCTSVGHQPYLPRARELCIAYEGGELHRCLNLKSVETWCLLFFVDDGQTAWVETKNIRKMEIDFLEVVSQAICVKLSDKWKENEENKSKVLDFLKDSVGKKIQSHVHEAVDDYFIISIPKLDDMLK